MKAQNVLMVFVIVLVLIVVGCSPAPPPEPTATPVPTAHPGKSIVSSNCIACHDIGRVSAYKGNRDSWGLTVDRMILLGVKISEEQRDLAVDYLALTYPGE